jgi:hypothetical protein
MVIWGVVDFKSFCWLFKCWRNAFSFFSPYGQMLKILSNTGTRRLALKCFFLCHIYIFFMRKSEITGGCGIRIPISLVWSLDNLLKEKYRHNDGLPNFSHILWIFFQTPESIYVCINLYYKAAISIVKW